MRVADSNRLAGVLFLGLVVKVDTQTNLIELPLVMDMVGVEVELTTPHQVLELMAS